MNRIPIGIFVPAYNEEHRLPLADFKTFLQSSSIPRERYKLVFVNDGSKDRTVEILFELQNEFPEQVAVVNNERNQGKAETIRHAFLQHPDEFELLGYLDADLATGLEEFYHIGELGLRENKQVIFGSRIKKLGSHIERKNKRHILGRIFATMVSFILHTPIYDTQCGAKYFSHHLIETGFSEKFISKWIFDVEIFARIIVANGYHFLTEKGLEVPLKNWFEKGDSKIKLTDMLRVPQELLAIKNKYAPDLKRLQK